MTYPSLLVVMKTQTLWWWCVGTAAFHHIACLPRYGGELDKHDTNTQHLAINPSGSATTFPIPLLTMNFNVWS